MKKPDASPWKPAPWEPADIASIQALVRGDASPEQQRRAIDYIINDIAGTYDLSYRPDSERDTAFAKGKRAVGKHIDDSKMVAINALKQGTATSDQQQSALDYMIAVAGTYDLCLDHDPNATAFAEGRRYVGLQLVKCVRVNLAAIRQAKEQSQK